MFIVVRRNDTCNRLSLGVPSYIVSSGYKNVGDRVEICAVVSTVRHDSHVH
jgi:hypothetical protein